MAYLTEIYCKILQTQYFSYSSIVLPKRVSCISSRFVRVNCNLLCLVGQFWTKVWVKKRDTLKNWPLIKNPHFLCYLHETLWKWLTCEMIFFTKFHDDRTKSVDLLLVANFWTCLIFFDPDFITRTWLRKARLHWK